MMMPRTEIAWLDVNAPLADSLALMAEHQHTRYPVCRGGLDNVLGIVGAQPRGTLRQIPQRRR